MIECSAALRTELGALRLEDLYVPQGLPKPGETLIIPGKEVPEDFKRACTLIKRKVSERLNGGPPLDPLVFEAGRFSRELLATFPQAKDAEHVAVCKDWDIVVAREACSPVSGVTVLME
jgi:hypothetical protein